MAGYRGLSVPVNRLFVCGRLQGAECSVNNRLSVCGRLQGAECSCKQTVSVWQVTGG